MPLASSSSVQQNLKHRVFTCLTKLSDRDTHSLAVNELESIARSLEPNSFPVFLSCIHSTDASDKSPVRKQCVSLLATLSETHGNTLSPYLVKMLTNVTRRLRDPDSAVRSACVSSVAALSTHITKPPFSSFLKPLTDALFTEQDLNSQIGAALCLASAIENSPDPEPVKLAKLMPRFEKLLKCDSFKAKPAVLTMIGSVIVSGGVSGHGAMRNLVPCLMEFLSSEDWGARKAAAEALTKLAVVERDMLTEFKAGCLKTFENRRFDKVKVVREVMNQMLETWKQIPDLSEEVSPPPHSIASSRGENASDGRYPPASRNYAAGVTETPQLRKKPILSDRSTPPDNSYATSARKRSPLKSNENKSSPAMFQKLDRKKPSNWKVEIAVPNAPTVTEVYGDHHKETDENVPERRTSEKTRISKLETRRTLFHKSSDDKGHKNGGFRSGSRVAPVLEENRESTVVVSNVTEDIHKNHRECEDLSLIRNQLVQIEKQQTSLLDLLQRFIGSSQNGMRALETRVHGLELALDEISYDLALSTGRMAKTESASTTCCMLPGADFLSSKFWRKTEGRYSASRYSTSSSTPSVAAMRYRADNSGNAETLKLENRRFRLQGGGGFIVNPLAEMHSDSRGN
ncbi:TORTIFOLIA1-like protein 3 isoform X1 [Ziziphus jujuba]|uniref:TORTIFOLIA1-like protein 3 isoform X1 n=1 Tax=Ziziphus jujuba TaxID=326968 RepID=A0A9B4DZA7_ZIZJJ|nr:TORTIFOLIA1-like protein 3 isoform X1 [Ziziphus jujuba]XP_015883619.2 TORTIFOLIA1-like protein 3 isoform X1 [Ziziphus jujuba]XP_015883620.2 TORTIFOLIA1-like protein 3 isoform X1 [Ziziphus jujuba]